MGGLLPYLVVTGSLAAAMGFFAWLARVVRRRGVAGAAVRAAMAAYDEAFHVTAHDSHHEIRAQAERRAPVATRYGRSSPMGRSLRPVPAPREQAVCRRAVSPAARTRAG
ncbi:MAG TPA: hypothetical protein VE546_04035 [Streptomyces sp.]|uniref:hypothetical protein n=1 Tax=Streptomyces sp. TaxID=1931 RepID=UPI002D46782C|nr:hypothetical protein [Streptomyces sp.]HZG02745.1 hypothetical protein [Streptomyces sp.]